MIYKREDIDFDAVNLLTAQTLDTSLSTKQLAKLQQNEDLSTLVVAGETVGYLAQKYICGEAELLQIVIGLSYQRQGFAKNLMTYWHEELEKLNVEDVFLEVREDNSAALALYNSLDYKKVGLRKNYYLHNGVYKNAHVMKFSLLKK